MKLAIKPISVWGSFAVYETLNDKGEPDGRCAVVGSDGTIAAIFSLKSLGDAELFAQMLDAFFNKSPDEVIAQYPELDRVLDKKKMGEKAITEAELNEEERLAAKKELERNYIEEIVRYEIERIKARNSQDQQIDENNGMKY